MSAFRSVYASANNRRYGWMGWANFSGTLQCLDKTYRPRPSGGFNTFVKHQVSWKTVFGGSHNGESESERTIESPDDDDDDDDICDDGAEMMVVFIDERRIKIAGNAHCYGNDPVPALSDELYIIYNLIRSKMRAYLSVHIPSRPPISCSQHCAHRSAYGCELVDDDAIGPNCILNIICYGAPDEYGLATAYSHHLLPPLPVY